MLIDTHAHLDDSQFDADREETIKRAFSGGVEKIINIGAGLGSSKRSVELAEKHENIFAAVGLHPHYFMKHETWGAEHKNQLEKLAEGEKVVAIGEVGLEYYFYEKNLTEEEKNKIIEKQKEGFMYQIELAVKNNLPLVIHCREAYKDILDILTEEKKKYGKKLRGILHSYLGRASYAREFIKLDFKLGFNGIITYARDYDKIILETDLENIFLETDCPYLTPAPFKGQRNEPAYVKYTAEKIAEIKGVSLEKAGEATTENAKRLFGIA
jgi:TatD DNase family protein